MCVKCDRGVEMCSICRYLHEGEYCKKCNKFVCENCSENTQGCPACPVTTTFEK